MSVGVSFDEAMSEITIEDQKQVVKVLFRNALLIVLVTMLGAFGGMVYMAKQPDTEYRYDATATLSVVFGQNLGQLTGSTVISNYRELLNSSLISDYAATLIEGEGITGDQIRKMVSASSGSNSFVLKITARSASPRNAILVANAVAESFVTQVPVLTGSNTIQVLDHARSVDIVKSGSSIDFRLIAPAGAFLMICAVLILFEIIGDKVRSVKQCITAEGELLAIIPKVKRKKIKVRKNA